MISFIKKSIRNKLIFLLFLTTVVPFSLSLIVTYFHTSESLKENAIQENLNLLYQGKVNIETNIKELNSLTLSIYRNPDFMNYLKSSRFPSDFISLNHVNSVLQTLLYSDESINRVYMSIIESHQLVSVSRRSAVVYTENVVDIEKDYYLKARENQYNMYLEAMYNPSPEIKRSNSFTLHRAFINVPGEDLLAYISLEIKPEKIAELSRNLYDSSSEEFYIIDQEGNFIFSSQNGQYGKDDMKWINLLLNTKNERGSIEWNDEHFQGVMVYDKIAESTGNWLLVKRLPYTTLHESAYDVAVINIIFGVIGLVLVILATLFVSFRITNPIRVLVQNIQQVEQGNMQTQFKSLGSDEIGILGERFRLMIGKINHLINREYKLELENKTNQLKVLQSQINPHFLYNALQSIGTIALKNKVPEVYTSLTDLSHMLRYGMNMDEGMVSLDKEVNYTKSYFLLQKQRFGDDLDYSIEVDKDALNVKVPKMMLQPIIENYFKHGFDIREGVGKIQLKCTLEDSFLLVQIIDNGLGITEERLIEIRRYLYEENASSYRDCNIGLKNVYARLKLYYSDKATLDLTNLERGGLCVMMKLPAEMEGNTYEGDHYR
ncbi:cache domain-containing sensor histidine kinase [Halalkalibacter urbisdiaboli]|uniref:cache domain-containing sensor histidine kinase n=1 Tax=Halalkalibacter urbisdiaboli TaxID=1960589 RepID=UPI000B43C932|nr:sensor histidine kinase [Halalkalibacter urbisdiaboli]